MAEGIQVKPRKLSDCARRVLCWSMMIWTGWMAFVLVIGAVIAFQKSADPDLDYSNMGWPTVVILIIISVPFVLVAWMASPLKKHLNATGQYVRIKHLRTLTGLQAALGLAVLTVTYGIDSTSQESLDLFTALTLWTAAALFHFVPFGLQIRMETPEQTSAQEPHETSRS